MISFETTALMLSRIAYCKSFSGFPPKNKAETTTFVSITIFTMYSPFFSSKLFQIVVYVLLCNTDIFRPRLSLCTNSREMLSGRILLFVAV